MLGQLSHYRGVGPQQGRKVFTLQTIPSWEDDDRFSQVAKVSGFNLHAGVAAHAWERQKLETMPIYFKTSGIREAAVTDILREYSVRRERNHKCHGRRDAQE
ncbi:MAG: hypothetical protein N0E62_13405 [Candidatus Thiodiazotropha lotti]|nr:hypothetical protein [Candidatus Thiodiazotropha lotti]MCW4209367.1 hypothetical protein [Candidatus Thiodiazotropha lotti]MCW4210263.1 hypothetical protein [Candidatus Thiodiazotropha lotti]